MSSVIKSVSRLALAVPALAVALAFVAVPVSAQCDTTSIQSGADCVKPDNVATQLFGQGSVFSTVINVMLFLIGALSVVMLIVGGVRYVISGGDQATITSAKNTILYAIIGIVIAFLAYAAVNFVTTQLGNSAS